MKTLYGGEWQRETKPIHAGPPRKTLSRSRTPVKVIRTSLKEPWRYHLNERENELRYAERLSATDNLRRKYTAYGAARVLWGCRDEEILIEGPAGTGKTRAILEKMHLCAMKYPGFRGLIIRKTRESLTNSVLVTFEEKVVPPDSPILAGPKRRLRSTYYYQNGAEVDVGGMDKASKIMSTEYDMICCFETTELSEEDLESLTTRLRNWQMPYQQLIADCNPGAPKHWLNRRPATKGMTRLLSRHEDNPHLYDHRLKQWTLQGKKYIEKLDRLSGARRLRLRFGKWAAAEGMVYQTYDADVHLIEHRTPPNGVRKIRVVDFGFTNPFVCQWWWMDHDYRMYLYREVYFAKRIVADHAKVIRLLSRKEEIEATICDWDAEDRATLEREGIPTTGAFKDIRPGIDAVEARLRKAEDGKPRIFFMRDCIVETDRKLEDAGLPTCTVDEFDGYVYQDRKEGKSDKEEPIDKDNHGMDAMRYAVAYVDDLASLIVQVSAEEASSVFVSRAA